MQEAVELHDLVDIDGYESKAVWLGGRREAGEGEEWGWSDGSNWGWTGWLEGQPSKEVAQVAMCIKSRRVVGVQGGEPYWYDIQCSNRLYQQWIHLVFSFT